MYLFFQFTRRVLHDIHDLCLSSSIQGLILHCCILLTFQKSPGLGERLSWYFIYVLPRLLAASRPLRGQLARSDKLFKIRSRSHHIFLLASWSSPVVVYRTWEFSLAGETKLQVNVFGIEHTTTAIFYLYGISRPPTFEGPLSTRRRWFTCGWWSFGL